MGLGATDGFGEAGGFGCAVGRPYEGGFGLYGSGVVGLGSTVSVVSFRNVGPFFPIQPSAMRPLSC